MNRREFSALLPLFVTASACCPAEAQNAPAAASLSKLQSGQFLESAPHGPSATGRTQSRLLLGMLPDNIRLESHVTTLAPGAPPMSLRAEALLMAADRAEHVAEVVAPALAAGEWVVSDRFSGSTLAYQGYGRGLEVEDLARLVVWATAGLVPDLSILVDVPVAVAQARLGRSVPDPDRMERLGPDFAQRVRDGFLALAAADPARWAVVDGTGDVADITAHIVKEVRERMGEPETDR